MKAQITEALRVQFRPEFLNRIDESSSSTPQRRRSGGHRGAAAGDLQRRLAEQEIVLELTPAAKSLIVAKERTRLRARPLKRTIQASSRPAGAACYRRVQTRHDVVGDADAIAACCLPLGRLDGRGDAGQRRDARKRVAPEPPARRPGFGRGTALDAGQPEKGQAGQLTARGRGPVAIAQGPSPLGGLQHRPVL